MTQGGYFWILAAIMQKVMVTRLAWLLVPLALIATRPAHASARTQHKVGAYVRTTGITSDYYTANVGVNLGDSWRIHAGEGVYLNSGTKFVNPEVGAIYLFSTSNLSPYLGASFENIAPSKNPGVSTSGLAADMGVDWTADIGFNLGLGAMIPLSSLTTVQLSFYVGWYF